MEFILYRLIQLSKRELLLIDEILGFLLSDYQISGDELAPMNRFFISKQQSYAHEFNKIRHDKEDECNALAKLLKIGYHDTSFDQFLKEVYHSFDHNVLASTLCNDLLMLNAVVNAKSRLIQKYFHLDCSRLHHRLFQIDAAGNRYLSRNGEYEWVDEAERQKLVN